MRSFEVNNDRLGLLHGLTQDFTSSRRQTCPSPPQPKSPRQSSPPSDNNKAPKPKPGDSSQPRQSKFRFKKKHRKGSHRHHSHSSSSRPTHSSKRHKHSDHKPLTDDPAEYDDTYIPNAASFKYSTSDDAFRESLFDAMADDEGAAFWEGVYGQPINIYPRPDARGKLEKMTDEEYAEYVRSKMWEKTHEHIIEERKKREEAREARKKRDREEQRMKEEQKMWEEKERSGRREERARRQRGGKERVEKRWNEYLFKWKRISAGRGVDGEIPWPVESGMLGDIEKKPVERFFLDAESCLDAQEDIVDVLKAERIRWHPDKAQQRWRERGLSEEEVKGITAVFQAVDSMWVERNGK